MPLRAVPSSSRPPQWNHRTGALALAVLVLLSACATRVPSSPPRSEPEHVFTPLPTDFAPVQLDEAEFQLALAGLLLEEPLRLASSGRPLYASRTLALASPGLTGEAWRSELARSYGRFCEHRGTPGDCLTLFEDGPHLRADDKRALALALAVGPALEGLDAEVRDMLSPTRILATVSVCIGAWLALLVAPEPLSKGVAAAATVLLWGYLGWEFFELIDAYMQLAEEAERASTFEELRAAGERFGRVIGPNSLRILVLVGTAAVGETAALLSRAPKLPGFGQAVRNAELSGLRMAEAAAGAERVIVSVPAGPVRVVVPPHAMASASRGTRALRPPPSGHRAFGSFASFKRAMGRAGKDKNWHHIVEQHPDNVRRFGPEALHNTENIIQLDTGLHTNVSAFYSSKRRFITGTDKLTVRQWLKTQSYENQRAFGLRAIENIRKGIWR
jgi:hypothetical protein